MAPTVLMVEHFWYCFPSNKNGKMHLWSGFGLNNAGLASVLHVFGFPRMKHHQTLKFVDTTFGKEVTTNQFLHMPHYMCRTI